MDKNSDKMTQATERVAETMGATIVDVIDRLAGKKSDLKLSFQDLSFDTGVFKASLNGAIVLDVVVAKPAESSSSTSSQSVAYYPSS